MAKFVLKDPFLSVGGNDVSDHVESITLNAEVALQEVTAGGDDGIARLTGLFDWSAEVNFRQNFANSGLDDVLFAAFLAGVAVAVIIRPTTAVVGTSNPQFTGNALIARYAPLGGSIGQVVNAPLSLMCSDGVKLARAEA